MLDQSSHLTKVLRDKTVLIEAVATLLGDILKDTGQLERGNSLFHCKQPPAISIQDYLKRISKFSYCSASVFIISLIYIDRLQQAIDGFVLNRFCIHKLLITTTMMGAKFIDDFFYKNQYYAKVGGITKAEVNALELQMLEKLNYNLFISDEEMMVYSERLQAYLQVNLNQS